MAGSTLRAKRCRLESHSRWLNTLASVLHREQLDDRNAAPVRRKRIVCEWIQTRLSRWQSDVKMSQWNATAGLVALCVVLACCLRAKVRAREQLSNWALSPSEERCSMFHLAGSWPWPWHHRPFICLPRTGPYDLYVDIMVCIHRDCSVTTTHWFVSPLS